MLYHKEENFLMKRREFLETSALLSAGLAITSIMNKNLIANSDEPAFKISLAQWSLHRALREGKIDNLDFAKIARQEFGIEAVEYVNQFFKDKAVESYLAEMKKRAEDYNVQSILIMCDGEGRIGDPDQNARRKSVQNHEKWVKAATPYKLALSYSIFSNRSINTEYLSGYEGNEFALTGNLEEDLLSITSVHPMRKDAVEKYVENANCEWDTIEILLTKGELLEVNYNGNTFYARNFHQHGSTLTD